MGRGDVEGERCGDRRHEGVAKKWRSIEYGERVIKKSARYGREGGGC